MKIGRYITAFVLFVMALIVFGDRGLVDNYRLNQKMMAIKKINHEMTLENIALKKNIHFSETTCPMSRRLREANWAW